MAMAMAMAVLCVPGRVGAFLFYILGRDE